MKKTDAAAVAEKRPIETKKRPGGTFSCPAWASEVNFYAFGLKTGYIALLHVIGGGARPRTDSVPSMYTSVACPGSSLHAGTTFWNHARIDFFYAPLSRRFSARRRKRERITMGESGL